MFDRSTPEGHACASISAGNGGGSVIQTSTESIQAFWLPARAGGSCCQRACRRTHRLLGFASVAAASPTARCIRPSAFDARRFKSIRSIWFGRMRDPRTRIFHILTCNRLRSDRGCRPWDPAIEEPYQAGRVHTYIHTYKPTYIHTYHVRSPVPSQQLELEPRPQPAQHHQSSWRRGSGRA